MTRILAVLLVCNGALSACAHYEYEDSPLPLRNAAYLPKADISVEIPSLSNCTHPGQTELNLDSGQPVVVIVHGCFSSAGRFRSLADVFAFHGQQAICFNYDDRASLIESSARLITAITALSDVMQNPNITVIGHSQGGLVARRAFIDERPDPFDTDDANISLTTISAPFGGIKSASHCASTAYAWFSLGISRAVCKLVTGDKYREIPPGSEFIEDPGELLPNLNGHLKISTDETESCRVYNARGSCKDDDFVFSIAEQTQEEIDDDVGLSSVLVKAGHVEIVGDGESIPIKLIGILQQHGILNATPEEMSEELVAMLTQLYLSDEDRQFNAASP
jgi:hypothetical protein